jgi:hypothetical protein
MKIVLALLSALALAVITLVLWMASAAAAMAVIPEQGMLLVGYTQIALIPIALIVGASAGLLLSLFGWLRGLKRWLIAIAGCALIGVIINGGMAFLVTG